ncbi:MAG: NTP transferase domain-containing protein [Terracidiphilus sp.]|nr:NTP transferase domain-containing protein [Terracidiphilus sp.]MDR3798719.1 NTP transferase domain-containing protein [Terracidiphilus sp.]
MKLAGRGPAHHDTGPDAIGFVLAGGQSSRMGRDKALLEFAGRPLAVQALSILGEAGIPAMIAGAAAPAHAALEVFAQVIEDVSPGLGPLSGICEALATTSARYAVFLPVDLPLLPPSLLDYLLRHARITASVVTVSSVSGFAQTFPVVLDHAALPALQNELDSQRYGCFSAFQAASASMGQSVSSVAVELLAQTGEVSDARGLPPIHWFLNLNTPDDLKRAEALQAKFSRRIA